MVNQKRLEGIETEMKQCSNFILDRYFLPGFFYNATTDVSKYFRENNGWIFLIDK